MNIINNDQFVAEFERRLCQFTNAPYAVAVDRCTNAILLSLLATTPITASITIPNRTYLSVPMTLRLHGYSICWSEDPWYGSYRIGGTLVHDCAVDFRQHMYAAGQIQCLSFHQKKHLPIGKGGAILTDDPELYQRLRRMRHDGRDSGLSVQQEIDSDPTKITMGYHMNMSPDEAARGILLLNQYSNIKPPGASADYPNISSIPILRTY